MSGRQDRRKRRDLRDVCEPGRSQSPHSTAAVAPEGTDRERTGQQNPSEGRRAGRWMRDERDEATEASAVPTRLHKAERLTRLLRGSKPRSGRNACCRRWATASKAANGISLMDKVFAPDTLAAAWTKVRANQGAAGVDGQSIERFAAKAEEYLTELAAALREGSLPPASRQTGRHPEGRWQDETAGHPDGQGSHRPAGGPARDRTDFRARVLRRELRLPSGARMPRRAAGSRSADQGGLHPRGGRRPASPTSIRSRMSG